MGDGYVRSICRVVQSDRCTDVRRRRTNMPCDTQRNMGQPYKEPAFENILEIGCVICVNQTGLSVRQEIHKGFST